MALRLFGFRCALSDDSSFNSYPSRPEVYLVKKVVRQTTIMEGSHYWGYGYKTQHSYPRSWLITWRRPEVKFGRNVVRKKYQDEDKKPAINKKKDNSWEFLCLQNPLSWRFPCWMLVIERFYQVFFHRLFGARQFVLFFLLIFTYL